MNILYKYCDCQGGIKILSSLELKVPFVADVNDPYDCRPDFFCGDNKGKIKNRCLQALNNQNKIVPPDFEKHAEDLIAKNEIQNSLINASLKVLDEKYKEYCLLSVSKSPRNPTMWAHYAEGHQGIVIGIDFDALFYDNGKIYPIKMHKVDYILGRLRVDVLDDEIESMNKILMTKTNNWRYEEEFRTIFVPSSPNIEHMTLEYLQRKSLASTRDFKGKRTWFLRLNPVAIKQVIFGLHTEESLKSVVKRLVVHLSDVKLYQVQESKTDEFDLAELN